MSTLAEPPPPPMLPEEVPQRPPLQRFLLVEADQFCPCGYNLHGQRVTFDERLDIPVVRCPECGKWHPAGHGSTAMRPWLARLATVLLAVWCLFNLGFTLAVLMTLFGVTMGRTVGDTVEVAQLPDGRQVTVVWDDTGKTSYRSVVDGEVIPQENLVIETRLVPSSHPMAKHRSMDGTMTGTARSGGHSTQWLGSVVFCWGCSTPLPSGTCAGFAGGCSWQ